MPYYTYPLLYSITIIVGLLNYRKYKCNKFLKLFLYFLFYSLFTELLGYLNTEYYIWKTNGFIYSTWNILSFIFYSYFIYGNLRCKRKRFIIKLMVVVFLIFTAINFAFYMDFLIDHMIYNTLIAISLIALMIILYFIDAMQKNDILNLNRSLKTWVLLGAFLYNIGFIPAFTFVNYTSFFGMFQYITFSLNIIMHSCFIIGFVYSRKEFNI